MRHVLHLPPGWKVTFFHRHCPRCGLDLTQHVPDSGANQRKTDQVEYEAGETGVPWVAGDFVSDAQLFLQRMVAPLTESEKEHAKRNEQRWLSGQSVEISSAGEQKHREARNHEDLVPIIKRKFVQWAGHVSKFIRGRR